MDMASMWTGGLDAVVAVSHLLATVNSSINFVIYCYKDVRFRMSLLNMFAACTGTSPAAANGRKAGKANGKAKQQLQQQQQQQLKQDSSGITAV